MFCISKKEKQRDLVSIHSEKRQKAPKRKKLQRNPCTTIKKSPEWGIKTAKTLSNQTLTAVSSYQSEVHSLSTKAPDTHNQQ